MADFMTVSIFIADRTALGRCSRAQRQHYNYRAPRKLEWQLHLDHELVARFPRPCRCLSSGYPPRYARKTRLARHSSVRSPRAGSLRSSRSAAPGFKPQPRRSAGKRTLPASAKGHFRAVPDTLAQARLRTIVGVGIPLDAIEGKMKLNRDKSIKDRLRVIAALEERGGENGMAIADVIRSQPDILVAIAG